MKIDPLSSQNFSRILLIKPSALDDVVHTIPPPFAALVPGTTWETKQWDPARFAEVGRWLKQRGFGVVILGASRERPECEKTAYLCPGAIDFCGKTTLGELGR